MSLPLFSCVVPVKGERPFFDEAIASLRAQGMGDDLEIIVQDADVEPDRGQSDAFNKGFAKARGEWFFWLNADDVLLPGALKKVQRVISDQRLVKTEFNWIVGDMVRIDANGMRIGCSVGNRWHDWLYRHAVPHVHGPSSFFRRDLWEKVGGCDVSLRYCMDWDLWIRFMKAGARYVRVSEFLWTLRKWEGSKTQRALPPEELSVQWEEILRMFKKNHFVVTRTGLFIYHMWRFLSGCHLREWFGCRCGGLEDLSR